MNKQFTVSTSSGIDIQDGRRKKGWTYDIYSEGVWVAGTEGFPISDQWSAEDIGAAVVEVLKVKGRFVPRGKR